VNLIHLAHLASAQVNKEKQLERSSSQLLVQNPRLMEKKLWGPPNKKLLFLYYQMLSLRGLL